MPKVNMPEKTRKKLPPDELDDILGEHRRWLESGGTLGRRADLKMSVNVEIRPIIWY